LARKKKPINTTSYPDHVIEKVARCLLPDILTYFESEEGQKEFEEWKALQETVKEKTGESQGSEQSNPLGIIVSCSRNEMKSSALIGNKG